MKFADHLSKEQVQELNDKVKSPKKQHKKEQSKPKKKENLSYRDIEKLMNQNKRGLRRRKGGAWG